MTPVLRPPAVDPASHGPSGLGEAIGSRVGQRGRRTGHIVRPGRTQAPETTLRANRSSSDRNHRWYDLPLSGSPGPLPAKLAVGRPLGPVSGRAGGGYLELTGFEAPLGAIDGSHFLGDHYHMR